ncbi:MAG: hypothetical protein RL172_2466 [Bacteroidota bacterium]|jgi:hypothetical protein
MPYNDSRLVKCKLLRGTKYLFKKNKLVHF